MNETKYLIGQRVIVDGNKIAIVVSRNGEGCLERYDVKFVSGLVQWRQPEALKPLPGGQL